MLGKLQKRLNWLVIFVLVSALISPTDSSLKIDYAGPKAQPTWADTQTSPFTWICLQTELKNLSIQHQPDSMLLSSQSQVSIATTHLLKYLHTDFYYMPVIAGITSHIVGSTKSVRIAVAKDICDPTENGPSLLRRCRLYLLRLDVNQDQRISIQELRDWLFYWRNDRAEVLSRLFIDIDAGNRFLAICLKH